jgi:IMP dehydrogenase
MMKYAYTYDDIQIVPKYSEVNSRNDCLLSTRFTRNYNLHTPIVAAPMDTVSEGDMAVALEQEGCATVIHRFMSIESQVNEVQKLRNVTYRAAAIGVTGDYKERAQELANANVFVILLDVAHGNTQLVQRALNWCKLNLPGHIDIIAGNVATRDGAYNLAKWGADAIRVGIGNGSLCETRIRTGVGIPQVTALWECLRGVGESGEDVPVIADGGIKTTGDVAKALSIGADSVMLGSLLAGTRESPGDIQRMGMWPDEQLFKKYRGSASAETKKVHGLEEKNVEGNSKLIPYKGKVGRIISDIKDGVRSAMSYVGANNLVEFRANSNHVLITQNGLVEAKPHLLL